MISDNGYANSAGGFGAIASAFVIDALGEMVPWLMVMAALVIADLIAGVTRSLKQKQKVRFSKACRDTISKFVVYFSVVVVFAFYDVASGNSNLYAEWACFLVMIIEAASIASNILKWHGYDLDFNKLVSLIAKKKFNLEDGEMEGVIIKDGKKRDAKTGRFMK